MTRKPTKEPRLTIRPYRDSHRDELLGLWEACGLTRPWNNPERDIARFAETASSEIFLGLVDGEVIASIAVGHDGHRGWVYYLAVAPEARNRGHGTAMLRHAEDWLKGLGIPKVQLLVRPEIGSTRTFYARAGYEPNDCTIMQRWLEEQGGPRRSRGQPDGRIPVTITFLEMTQRPMHPHVSPPQGFDHVLLRVRNPSVPFYRYLYNGVGAPWLWFERRAMDDATLARIIQDEGVELYVLHVGGEPAGFAELDRRKPPAVELAYFGLLPNFIGKGLGRFLLTWAIDTAWSYGPERVWVNTNTLDHPKALPLYQRCGFQPYDQKEVLFDDPRLNGLIAG